MIPGTIMHLTKTITTKIDGCIATYKLNKDACVRVLVIAGGGVSTEAQIAAIDYAATKAKENIRKGIS